MRSASDAAERRRDPYVEALAAASRLVHLGDEIGAVHVVIGRRPTYVELRTARLEAERYGLTVSLSADGSLVMRRPTPGASPTAVAQPGPSRPTLDQRIAAATRRLVSDVCTWDAGFAGVREGTR